MTAAAVRQRPPVERLAEEQRRGEPVARHVTVQVQNVTGLLAPEHASLAPEGFEHVAVADVGRDDADPVLAP